MSHLFCYLQGHFISKIMKKSYLLIFTLLFTSITVVFASKASVNLEQLSSSLIITGYVDATCPNDDGRTLELYADGNVNLNGWSILVQNDGNGFSNSIDLSSLGTVSDEFIYITNNASTLSSEFGITTNVLTNALIESNGDDAFQVIDNNSILVDQFGVENVDGTNTDWNHLNTFFYRENGVLFNSGSFDTTNWEFGNTNSLNGQGLCNSNEPLSDSVPFGTFNINPTTEIQFINNSADPNLNLIDIYVDDVLEVDNLGFREATAFLDYNVGTQVEIKVATSNSSSSANSFYTLTTDLDQDNKYIIVANGVQNPSNFDSSINNPIDFELSLTPNARKVTQGLSGITDILFHHGATDLPSVDIVETLLPVGPVANNLVYSNFPNYIQVATSNYQFDVKSQDGTSLIITYDAPLSNFGLQNEAITIIASGFLDPTNNQSGEEFGLWLATPNGGDLLELPFVSNCSAENTPYFESFEGSQWQNGSGNLQNTGDLIDNCWDRTPQNDGSEFTWTVTSNSTGSQNTGPNSGFDNGRYIYSESSVGDSGDEAIFTSPIIDVSSLTIPALEFYYFMFGNNIGQLRVEAKAADGNTWNQLFSVSGQQQQNGSEEWIKQQVDLSSLSDPLIEVRFIAQRGTSFRSDIAIDAVSVKEFTTCPEPTNVLANNVTGTTVDLTWDAQPEASNGYNWYIYNSGDNPSTSTAIANGTTNPGVTSVSAAGLSVDTAYSAYVEAICDVNDISILSVPETFTTLPCTVDNQCNYTFTLSSQFTGGWNGETFDVIQEGTVIATLGPNFNSGNSLNVTVPLCEDANIELFWNSGGFFPANVGISIADSFGEEVFDKPFGVGSPNSSVFIFSANCTPPACPKPVNLSVDAQVLDAVTLSWDTVLEATNGYQWEVYNQGDNPQIATPVSSGTAANGDTNTILTGLSASTDYDVYLIADCDTDGLSDLSDAVSFTTPCVIETTPWTENFDSADWQPGSGFQNVNDQIDICWERNPDNNGQYSWSTGNGTTSTPNTGPSQDLSGSGKYIYAEASNGANGDVATITSPAIDLSQLTNPSLSYNLYLFGFSLGSLEVQAKDVNSTTWVTINSFPDPIQNDSNDPWEEFVNGLSAFSGETIQIRFVATRAGGNAGDIAVDSVSVIETPTCLLPNNFEVLNISDTTVDLSWDLDVSVTTGYEYSIFNFGDNPNTSTPVATGIVDQNTNSVNVTGLTSSTQYQAYIQSDCGVEGLSNLSQPIAFNTLACDASETCLYTFTLTDSFGDGWNGAEVEVRQDGVVIETLGTTFSTGSVEVIDIALCDDSNIELFWTVGGQFANEVGIIVEDSFDVEIYDMPNSASPNTSLTTFTADCDTTDCFAPVNFDVENILDTTADLTWDTFDNAFGGYDWFVFNAGDNPFTTPPLLSGPASSGDNSVTLTGLSENTSYDAYIRSDCGIIGVSTLSDPITFTTICSPVAAPFQEDFDSTDWQAGQFPNVTNDQIESCWSRNPDNSNNEYFWSVGDADLFFPNTGPEQDLTGGNYLYSFTNFGSLGDTANFTSPLVDLSNLVEPSLQFSYFMFGSDINQLEVQIKTISSNNWINLQTINGEQQTSIDDNWKNEIIDLSSFINESVQIRFIATRGFSNNSEIAIDRFVLDELPSCITPDEFNVSNVTDVSADFSWDVIANATDGYQVDVYLVNDDPATDTPVASSNTGSGVTTTTVSGLTNSTNYKAYVFADCGSIDGVSDLSIPVFFTTQGCPDSDQCDFTFELADSFGDGWNDNTIDVIQDGIVIQSVGENFENGSSFTETVSLCDGANIELFWNGGAFTGEISFTVIDPFNQQVYNKPQGAGQPGTTLFSFTSSCSPPPCDIPSNFSALNIQQTSVDLSWNQVTLASSGYNWFVYLAGDDPQTATPVTSGSLLSGSTLVNVSGLTEDTDYEAYIQSDCDFGLSALSNPLPFTTIKFCDTPTNLSVSNIQQTTVSLSWDENTDASNGYTWSVFAAGDNPLTGVAVATGSTAFGTTTANVTGLTADTDYEAYIEADCNFDQSNLSPALPFTTLDVCEIPNNLVVLDIEQTTVNLSWDEVTEATAGYNWFVFEAGDNPQTATAIDSGFAEFGTTTANVIGLTADTDYEAYIEADCNFDQSNLSAAVPFTTLDVCEVPDNLAVINIAETNVDLTWDEVPNAANGYTWYVFGAGDDPQTGTPIASGSTPFNTNSVNVTGLIPNTNYEAYIEADCSFDQSILSSAVPFTTLDVCEVPANLTVSNIGETSADLAWDEVSNATNGYNWYVFDAGENPQTATPVANGSTAFGTTTVNVTGLSINTSYEAYIEADCNFDLSDLSAAVPFTTLDVCEIPSGFEVINIGETSADLNWIEVSNAVNGYNWSVFLAGDDPLSDVPIASSSTAFGTTTINVIDLLPNTNYEAYIEADCSFDQSLLSPAVPFTTLDVCEVPANLTVSNIGENSADLTWDEVSNAANGYNWFVFVAGDNPQTATPVANGSSAFGTTSANVTGLSIDTDYEAYIEADCNFDLSDLSLAVQFTTLDVCEIPNNLAVVNVQQSTAELNWDEVSNAANGYNWFVFNSGDDPLTDTPIDSGSTVFGTTSVSVSGLTANTTYDAYIQADCNFGQSDLSTAVSFTTLVNNCDIPVNLSVNNIQQTTAELSWDDVSNASDGYNWFVFLAGDNPQTDTPVANGSSAFGTTSANVTGLSINTDYEAYIEADCNFNQSNLSAAVPFTTLDVCEIPNNLAVVNVQQSTAELNWDEVSNAANGYNWFVFNNGDDPLTATPIDSGSTVFGTTSVSVSGLNANTTYDAYIQADCNFGQSDLSVAVSFTTLVNNCDIPVNFSVSNIQQTTAELSWDEVSNTTDGYDWFVFLAGDNPQMGTPVATGSTAFSTTSVNVTGLSPNTDYEAYVQADCNFDQSGLTNAFAFTTTGSSSPANDAVCNSIGISIGDASNAFEFDNTNASTQVNEPNPSCFGNGLNSSVWFSFVAPATGSIDVNTDFIGGTLTDTEIAVYENTSTCNDFTAFVEIACSSDGGLNNPDNAVLTLDNLTPGETYYIQVDNGNNSAEGSFGIEVNETLSVDVFAKTNFNFYPNPVKSQLFIESNYLVNNVQLFDITGKKVIDQSYNQKDLNIDLSRLSSGTYLIRVKIDETYQTFKVIKE